MHDPAPLSGVRIAVNAAIFDDRGRLLVTRRSPTIVLPDLWCLPGGHLDPGERLDAAVVREVREETGLEVEVSRLLGVYSDPDVCRYPTSDPPGVVQVVVVVFQCHVLSGKPAPTEEVSEVRWCTQDDVPQPLVRSHGVRIADAFAGAAQAVYR